MALDSSFTRGGGVAGAASAAACCCRPLSAAPDDGVVEENVWRWRTAAKRSKRRRKEEGVLGEEGRSWKKSAGLDQIIVDHQHAAKDTRLITRNTHQSRRQQ